MDKKTLKDVDLYLNKLKVIHANVRYVSEFISLIFRSFKFVDQWTSQWFIPVVLIQKEHPMVVVDKWFMTNIMERNFYYLP